MHLIYSPRKNFNLRPISRMNGEALAAAAAGGKKGGATGGGGGKKVNGLASASSPAKRALSPPTPTLVVPQEPTIGQILQDPTRSLSLQGSTRAQGPQKPDPIEGATTRGLCAKKPPLPASATATSSASSSRQERHNATAANTTTTTDTVKDTTTPDSRSSRVYSDDTRQLCFHSFAST